MNRKQLQKVIDDTAEALGLRKKGNTYVKRQAKNAMLNRMTPKHLNKAASKPAPGSSKAKPVDSTKLR